MRLIGIFTLFLLAAQADERVDRLSSFMVSYGCRSNHSIAYVEAADKYGLDYRLLPAISIVESSCGRFMRANNLFGWNSGRARFRTQRQAIEKVAQFLGSWGDTTKILKRYNPSKKYPKKVLAWMEKIDALYGRSGTDRSSDIRETASPVVDGARSSLEGPPHDQEQNERDSGSLGVLLARPYRIQACSVPMAGELQFWSRSDASLPR